MSEYNCGECSGCFHTVPAIIGDVDIPDDVVEPKTVCWNADCGCPGNPAWPTWCTKDHFYGVWCSASEDNCG
jgi:hypothetical protein